MLRNRDPNDHLVNGRVTLLGHAAWSMLHYFAQGECMVSEVAVVLAGCISTENDITTALLNYRDEQDARRASMQMGSRLIGDHIYHASWGAPSMRDQIMAYKTPEDWNRELDWPYKDTAPPPL